MYTKRAKAVTVTVTVTGYLLYRCMSRGYMRDTWECRQTDKKHTWTKTKTGYRTRAHRLKHMQHTMAVCRLGPGQKAFNQLRPGGRSPPVSYPVHVVFCLFLCVCVCVALSVILWCACIRVFCLWASIILCSPFLCHISISISSSYLLFLYTALCDTC